VWRRAATAAAPRSPRGLYRPAAQLGHARLEATVEAEQGAAGAERRGPGRCRAGDRLRTDAAVDLEFDVEAALVDEPAGRRDLGLHRCQVALPTEAGVDRHDQQQVDEVEHVCHRVQRRGRV